MSLLELKNDPKLLEVANKIALNKIKRQQKRKEKHDLDDSYVQCGAGVKISKTVAKSIIENEFDKTSMYVMTYIDEDKENTHIFKQCSVKCKDDNEYCGRHQKKFDEDPTKIIDFKDPSSYSGYELLSLDDKIFEKKTRVQSNNKKKIEDKKKIEELLEFMKFMKSDQTMMRRYIELKKQKDLKELKEVEEDIETCSTSSKSSSPTSLT